VGQLDPRVLKEFEITVADIRGRLSSRLTGLKSTYWKCIFDNIESITDRLTSKSRDELMRTAGANTHIDFTKANVYAVVVWVIKQANSHIDSQLLEYYDRLMKRANVVNYVSNKKVFKEDRWGEMKEEMSHVRLAHRIVLEYCGFDNSYGEAKYLTDRFCNLILDLRSIGKTLGFSVHIPRVERYDHEFRPGKSRPIYASHDGENVVLARVTLFKNGNCHIKFNEAFLLALNVRYGKLRGWIKTPREAAKEMVNEGSPKEKLKVMKEASKAFSADPHISLDPATLLESNS